MEYVLLNMNDFHNQYNRCTFSGNLNIPFKDIIIIMFIKRVYGIITPNI